MDGSLLKYKPVGTHKKAVPAHLVTRDVLNTLPLPLPARLLFKPMIKGWTIGRLIISDPKGQCFVFEGADSGSSAELYVHNWAVAKRILLTGDIGLAEGYMAGEWSSPDLTGLLDLLARNLETMHGLVRGPVLSRIWGRIQHALRRNTKPNARENIRAHYDLGEDFYKLWLDDGMTYSSARFAVPGQSLEDAQTHKYQILAESLGLKPGQHILEIGCGWGGFAIYAAQTYGVQVTALTISRAQYNYALQRVLSLGLQDLIDVRFEDYREIGGQFDAIASIEMFEAVGEAYWPVYFEKIKSALKPGGIAALQIITLRDDLFDHYRGRADFIQKYIFPGGMLPSLSRLMDESQKAGLIWRGVDAFGRHYADTLRKWDERFVRALPAVNKLGFDLRFQRLWRFYLCYCEAGFRTGRTDVVHITLTHEQNP